MTARLVSPGARELRRVVAAKGVGAVATACRTTASSVRRWVAGSRAPGADARLALVALGVALETSWRADVAPSTAAPAATKKTRRPKTATVCPLVVAPPLPKTTTAHSRSLVQVAALEHDVERARADGAPLREIAALSTSLTGALRLLARLSGEAEISETSILRSSAWAKVRRVLEEQFTECPSCAAGFHRRVQALEGRSE
jgi:hypothetical protein